MPLQLSSGDTQPFSTHCGSVASRMYITSTGAPLRSINEALALYSDDGAPSSSTSTSGLRRMNSSTKPWTVCGWNVQKSILSFAFWASAVPSPRESIIRPDIPTTTSLRPHARVIAASSVSGCERRAVASSPSDRAGQSPPDNQAAQCERHRDGDQRCEESRRVEDAPVRLAVLGQVA